MGWGGVERTGGILESLGRRDIGKKVKQPAISADHHVSNWGSILPGQGCQI